MRDDAIGAKSALCWRQLTSTRRVRLLCRGKDGDDDLATLPTLGDSESASSKTLIHAGKKQKQETTTWTLHGEREWGGAADEVLADVEAKEALERKELGDRDHTFRVPAPPGRQRQTHERHDAPNESRSGF